MTITKTEIRSGAYYDSVILMQLQRSLAALPGVLDAGVIMATPANIELLVQGGLYPPEAEAAKSDDLLLVVQAAKEETALEALAEVDNLISARRSTGVQSGFRPHTLAGAKNELADAAWLLISVPGRYAADLASEGLDNNLNVFLYSDNVSIEDEIALKQKGQEKGLFVMGPDCGTAIINGIGLGFANRVNRGPIGLVGASGTGLQAVTSEIHKLGSGVSHAIGTGGRDLKSEIGGITSLQGLQALANDPSTEVIVLVSKPPAPEVAAKLLSAAQACGKPVVVNFIAYPAPARRLGNVYFAVNLVEAAAVAVELIGSGVSHSDNGTESSQNGFLRGVFSGGTLAVEAVLGLQNFLYPLYSNVPVTSNQRLENPFESRAHSIVDLGEDAFTQGRLHPMMDNDLRIRRIRQEAADPETGMIWLDVVLGEGAHPDPASELVPVMREMTAAHAIPFLVVLIGTDQDPQDIQAQAAAFEQAGALVYFSIQEAIGHLSERYHPGFTYAGKSISQDTLNAPFSAVNAGLESFYESLTGQGASAVQMDWRPPAGGNEKLAALLARLKG